ncbi:MFS general substrate transporter [Ganoderma sinense ZZ0214-1]|uniref:MFS general substrate transporter n=1 Tax=Ganoderma sinense ZZ0214-1 TaxID=1077348 RepID=A0A2G8RPA4_9APHY|nr:MFS general substrate transporter [Ganoderma sinense ZZ0214-1]
MDAAASAHGSQLKELGLSWCPALASDCRRTMTSQTVPVVHQLAAPPGEDSDKTNKLYAASLIFSEEGSEPAETVSFEVVTDSDDEDESSNAPIMTGTMCRQKSVQFAALCMAVYLAGWNDALIGPLIPRLQEVYHVGYTTVSLVFIMSSLGYISGASAYVYLTDRFGFGLMVVVASIFVAISTCIQASAPPFPVFIVASFSIGSACMFLDGGSTAFVAGMADDTAVKLSIMYTAYGIAATCAPLVSARFAQLSSWSSVFLATVGFAVTTAILQVLAFKFKSQADCLKEIGQRRVLENTEDSQNVISKYKRVFRLPTVHLMAFFLFIHVGIEVTISGWIVTFMTERHGGPYSGYISSGFWAGSTIGRLALIPLTKKLGEWRALRLYILIAVGLELTMWLVSSFTINAAAVVLIGFVFGPIYATVMAHTGHILPPDLIGGAISWIAILTSAGSAVFPFMAGAVASRASLDSLPLLLVMMEGLMLVIWAFVPQHRPKLT